MSKLFGSPVNASLLNVFFLTIATRKTAALKVRTSSPPRYPRAQ